MLDPYNISMQFVLLQRSLPEHRPSIMPKAKCNGTTRVPQHHLVTIITHIKTSRLRSLRFLNRCLLLYKRTSLPNSARMMAVLNNLADHNRNRSLSSRMDFRAKMPTSAGPSIEEAEARTMDEFGTKPQSCNYFRCAPLKPSSSAS
jgi:hypothetical protein